MGRYPEPDLEHEETGPRYGSLRGEGVRKGYRRSAGLGRSVIIALVRGFSLTKRAGKGCVTCTIISNNISASCGRCSGHPYKTLLSHICGGAARCV